MQAFPSRLVIVGFAIECGLAAMLLAPPGPGRTLPFLALFGAVFALYLVAVRLALRPSAPNAPSVPVGPSAPAGPSAPGAAGDAARGPGGLVVVGLACLFRLTFLPAAPVLSNDLYRYLWDGRVLAAGGNPYGAPPAARAPSLPATGKDLARLEHAGVPTIYPPAAQILFAAGSLLGRGVFGIKALVVAADLLLILALRALLRARGQPAARALIYAWNPLSVTEVAWSGHVEPAAIALVLVAARAIIQKRDARAATALSLAALVKVLPLALLAPFLRSIRGRVLPIVPIVLAAGFWPFRAAGGGLLAGLRAYADRWLGNESLFAIVYAALVWIDPTPALKAAIARVRGVVPHTRLLDHLYGYVYPTDLAKGACALAVLAVAFVLWRRRAEPLRGACVLTGTILVLSPTLHPWYLLWMLPWLCLFPSRAWILLSGLVVLAYVNLGAQGRAFEPYPWIRLVEYAPFYALLCADWIRARARAAGTRRAGAFAGPRTGC